MSNANMKQQHKHIIFLLRSVPGDGLEPHQVVSYDESFALLQAAELFGKAAELFGRQSYRAHTYTCVSPANYDRTKKFGQNRALIDWFAINLFLSERNDHAVGGVLFFFFFF